MSYHWFKKMLLSTSILILSSSSLGFATHTVEAKGCYKLLIDFKLFKNKAYTGATASNFC